MNTSTKMLTALLICLRDMPHGALVLFTSRVQMQTAVHALDAQLFDVVLVQRQLVRAKLPGIHLVRVETGRPSVILGLPSFCEDMNL
ncbi:MAG: hypothetical protein GW928_08770 [Rhodoferax sp.]|nr:hypothetical protein [Betaproteobacteria bacterium]NCN97519.1 hypothetical protein [Rhodoferax sp.]OIP16115.1 MAG: hypothetical protein AUK50_09835 [Comamonadaceae bacterium CG2_30_57_122]PIZ21698.1 MAG: hypothetical protein COY49_12480 [Comamonadaceae bacterium CG_4_10_14_0_8_um_filter_57_29]PJC21619.1 MAG: hypothetical protein CO065_02310 [Comamonadaceae bacterium CG_4_9_14_0_8_um_filter_57_21]